MIQTLVDICLRDRKLVIFLAALLFAGGLYAVKVLNVEAYPDPAPPLLELITQKPGWSAEEMEQQVTVPLESGLNGMPSLDHLRSSSLFGLSDIKCYFKFGSDYMTDRQEVLNRLAMINLPFGIQPQLSPQSTIGEILRYQLVSSRHTLMELKEANDWILYRQFKQVAGVVDMTSFGGPTKQYHIDLDPHKLMAYKVSVTQVMNSLANANLNVGANYISVGPQSFNVRGIGLFKSLEDIENVVVAERGGIPTTVSQIATVSLGRKVPLGRVGRDHEEDIVNGVILMRVGGQSLPTLAGVNRKIEECNKHILPQGMKISTYADRTKLINITTGTVHHSLLSGMALVIFILMAFLGDLRASLIVAITIPLSLSAVFLVTVLTGQSANLISLGAIDFGIIVDASVFLIENVHRHLTFRDPAKEGMATIVRDAAAEVVNPIFFSTMVIFISFLPLFTMQGVEGKIFGPMAITYALALGVALLLGLTFAPASAAQFMKSHGKRTANSRPEDEDTIFVRILRRPYHLLLTFSVRHALPVCLLSLGALLVTGLLIPLLGGEFMPKLEEGNLWVRATMPVSISYPEASKIANQAREIFLRCPQVITAVSQLGRPDDGTDTSSYFNCEFYVPLTSSKEWGGLSKDKIIESIEKDLHNEIPGVVFTFGQAIEDNVEEAMSGVKGENSIKVVGADLDQLEALAEQIVTQVKQVPGVKDLGIFHLLGQPNLVITPDRKACARYGIAVGDVNNVVSAAVGGTAVTQVLDGDRRFDAVVRFQQPFRDSPESIARIPIATQENAFIPLSSVAKIESKTGAAFIYREDNTRFIPIQFAVRDRDLTSTISEIQERIVKNVKFPEGYYMSISGQFEQLQEAINRLKYMVPLTIVLVVLVLARSFGSLTDAMLIMITVPMACIGGVVALWMRGIVLSISAVVGFISLLGVCTLEGVLVVSRIHQNIREGMPPFDAVIYGGELRLRPVMMVGLGAAIGLLPAAISTGIGSETQKPLATVVVGGMLSSLIVTLLVNPALFWLIYGPKKSPKAPPPDPVPPTPEQSGASLVTVTAETDPKLEPGSSA